MEGEVEKLQRIILEKDYQIKKLIEDKLNYELKILTLEKRLNKVLKSPHERIVYKYVGW